MTFGRVWWEMEAPLLSDEERHTLYCGGRIAALASVCPVGYAFLTEYKGQEMIVESLPLTKGVVSLRRVKGRDLMDSICTEAPHD